MQRTSDGLNSIVPHSQSCDCQFCHRGEMDPLQLADIELRHAKPATDEEWQQFMDREFPRVQP